MYPAPNAKKSQQKLCTTLLAAGFVVVLGLAASKARAIAPIGDDASLFVTGVATIAYNDNIFLSDSHAKSSGVYDLVPGLSYEYGTNNALTKGGLQVYEDFQEFSSYSSINNQLFNAVFSNQYEDATSKINFDASMHQIDQPQRDIQANNYLVNRNVYHIDLTGEQKLDASSSIGAGVIFDDTDYRAVGYSDLKTTAIPVNYYLAVDPKLDFSFGGRVRFNTLEGGNDSTDVYVDIGARGEFTPNLTGEVDVGYNHQEIDMGRGTSGLGADASLTYAYSPKTNIVAGLTDDFGYAADGNTFRNISASLGFNSAIDEQWAIDGTATYGYYTYLAENRQDNFYTVQAGISYIVNLNFKVRLGYTLYDNSSTVSGASFDDDIVSVTGTLKF